MNQENFASHYFKVLVGSFIAYPNELKVTPINATDYVKVVPRCDSRDFGRIAGGGGETYKILKMLMRLAGDKHGKPIILERMARPLNTQREFPTPFRAKPDWNSQDTKKVEQILEQILTGVLRREFKIDSRGDAERTTFRVTIDDNEPLEIAHEELINALSRIIYAVGQARGREIYVTSA